MRVVDYVANFIRTKMGVDKIFMVTGGGAMFLNDGVAMCEGLEAICNHHEQASSMAALAYSKYSGKVGVTCVTTGCGGTNAITGVLDAWQDNTAMLILSGQVKSKEASILCKTPLRQFGVQEADIISIVDSITKYAVTITNPNDIAYHLEKAIFLATNERPGPVWLDIPMDIQGAIIQEENLRHFEIPPHKAQDLSSEINAIHKALTQAKRPMILAGNGIRLSQCTNEFKEFIKSYNIPVVSSYLGIDLLSHNENNFIGRLGTKGDRAGNFAIQNADLVIVLGCRLSVALTGFEYKLFAREAKIIVIDIDENEHKKDTIKIDDFYKIDLRDFFKNINKISTKLDIEKWRETCLHWKNKWSPFKQEHKKEDLINKYDFIRILSDNLKSDSAVVSDAGSAYYVTSQSLFITKNQRYITSGAQADMGFTLPACIGACIAKNGEVIGITGDGSLQMNLQELQTLVHYKLPIKLFVLNNNGYLSIRTTQNKFFEGRQIGTDKDSGISFPNLQKIAAAYGIKYYEAKSTETLDGIIKSVLDDNEPVICEIFCPENQEIIPNVSSVKRKDGIMISKPLEDMYPFLDRDEFFKEMIVKPLEE